MINPLRNDFPSQVGHRFLFYRPERKPDQTARIIINSQKIAESAYVFKKPAVPEIIGNGNDDSVNKKIIFRLEIYDAVGGPDFCRFVTFMDDLMRFFVRVR